MFRQRSYFAALLLQGVECLQCKRFYEALESWGTIGNQTVRLACGHTQQGGRHTWHQLLSSRLARAALAGTSLALQSLLQRVVKAGLRHLALLPWWPDAVGRDQLRQETSRHRYIYRPPDTQEGFWDMVRRGAGMWLSAWRSTARGSAAGVQGGGCVAAGGTRVQPCLLHAHASMEPAPPTASYASLALAPLSCPAAGHHAEAATQQAGQPVRGAAAGPMGGW